MMTIFLQRCFVLCMSFFPLSFIAAQNVTDILKEAARLEALPNEKSALYEYKCALKLQPANLHALCRASELCSRIAGREQAPQSKESYNQAAIIYAKTAYRISPNSDESNVAMAIAVGRTMLKKSGREKLAIAKEIKQYADAALKTNPNNFKAWHVIGKRNYEISNLSIIERGWAKLFFGSVPDASINNSIAAYERARMLNPGFALNYLELARAYQKNGNQPKAIALLKTLLTLPEQTEDDPRIKREAASSLKNWN